METKSIIQMARGSIEERIDLEMTRILDNILDPNTIVKLKPYRTFYEVEQPESEFLLRLSDDGKVGFFEADGGMWEMTARRTIKEYLEKALEKEIGENRVVVTL